MKEYLTTAEASVIAGVHQTTIIDWCNQGLLGRRVVGRWRIDRSELDRLLVGSVDGKKTTTAR
jgi:excisionase family DNA binding protein